MGWDASYINSSVFIAQADLEVLRARLVSNRTPNSTQSLFEWWQEQVDNEGNITELRFYTRNPKIGELESIADLVKNDSWIEVMDEDAENIFRYVFQNGKIERNYPTMTW